MKYCLGIDLGGTTVKMGIFGSDGVLVDKWEIPTRVEEEGKAILPDIAESIEEKLGQHQIEKSQLLGIGMGVPAAADENGVVQNTTNLGWGYKEVRRELEELTGIPVKVGNDANMAALGEMWKGGGKGSRNLVMVTLGTGVGGGIIVDGHILFGAGGACGEIGHICVNYEETERCGCGKRGCIEQYASATGIVRLAKRRLATCTEHTVLRAESVTAKDVWDAVKAGDGVAVRIAEEFGRYLGYALADVAAMADPEVFVIGGGVSKAGEILIDYVEKYYQEQAFYANKNVRFALAQLGNDAGICGAAKMILQGD